MATLNVQFADAAKAVIISYFGNPQDATIYANQGTIGADDTRWATYYNAFPATQRVEMPAPTV